MSPYIDPEAGEAWTQFSEAVFGGGFFELDSEAVEAGRSQALATRESALRDRSYDERTLSVVVSGGEMGVSIFVPTDVEPAGASIVWFHGGGMVLGSRFDAGRALDLVAGLGVTVASVDYRLAPEHPAPVPANDCYESLLWFADNASELGIDGRRIVIGGESAGGALAASTALRVRDDGGPRLAGLMLFAPMLDDRRSLRTPRTATVDMLWTRESNEFAWRSLLGERVGTDEVSIYDAPGRAEDLRGLPPTLLDLGSADLLRDESVAFASGIWSSGGDCELYVWAGGYHGSDLVAPEAAVSVRARHARRRWIERVLHREADTWT